MPGEALNLAIHDFEGSLPIPLAFLGTTEIVAVLLLIALPLIVGALFVMRDKFGEKKDDHR